VNPVPRGRLLALEGIDGCGKSTQAGLLADWLGEAGVTVVRTFEPGATELGRALRSLLLEPEGADSAPTIRTEALLMAADRSQHVTELLEPALAAGQWVVTDRYSGSTLAYQGWGRGLDVAELTAVVGWATGSLEPDLTVLVDVPVDVARQRLAGTAPDRLERLTLDFHVRVRAGFIAQAESDPVCWLMVDGDRSIDSVAVDIAQGVAKRLMQGTGDRS
jgi:dTMP kinase